jgi:hypothetical protein
MMSPLQVRMRKHLAGRANTLALRASLAVHVCVHSAVLIRKATKMVSYSKHLADELVLISDVQIYARNVGIELSYPVVVKLNTLRTKSLRETADVCLDAMKEAGMHWTDLQFLDAELTRKYELERKK